MRLFIITTMIIASACCTAAQSIIDTSLVKWFSLQTIDADSLQEQYPRSVFAEAEVVNHSLANGSFVSTTDGNTVWAIGYTAQGAQNLSVCLRNAQGCNVVVCSPDGKNIWMSDDNNPTDTLIYSDIITTDSIVIMCHNAPSNIRISSVYKGFRCIGKHNAAGGNKATGYGASSDCETSVACYTNIDNIKNAVCRLIAWSEKTGMYGTGTLINNTQQNGDPLVLTSAHVLIMPTTKIVARFGYEDNDCERTTYTAKTDEITGATIVAYDETSDMCLIRLTRRPNQEASPYWLGYNACNNTPQPTYLCVHHPRADAKMVSEENDNVVASTYKLDKTNMGNSFRTDFHWKVTRWDIGATEEGSSGCSITDAYGRVFGALSGGSATCNSPINDYFWRLDKAWSLTNDTLSSLSALLDPLNNGTTLLLDGLDWYNKKEDTPTDPISTELRILKTSDGLICKADSAIEVTVFDLWGREIYCTSSENGIVTIHKSNLPPNIFVARILYQNRVRKIKIQMR